MGKLTVFLILAGLFISVCASKVGGSYGHVRHRDINAPKYAKNVKLNLRKQDDSSSSDSSDSDDDSSYSELNGKNVINAESPQNENDQEQPENAPRKGSQNDPDEVLPLPEVNSDSADEEDGELASRGITAGDTFTPYELLPITRKLIEKVDNPGEGKGIVSSAKSPEDLADVLFESFFFGPRRIVTLEEKDIIGLDALQALALSGEEARRMDTPTQVTAPGYLMNVEDQIVKVSPRVSKYLLLRKSGSPKTLRRNKNKIYKFRNRKDKRMIKRRAPHTRQNLVKKLQKKRQLVLNPVRKNNNLNKTKVSKNLAVTKLKKETKPAINPARKNVKHDKTKAIKTSASTNVNEAIKPKVNSARKNIKTNKAKVTQTATSVKVNKGAKETQSSKIIQKNQRLQKLLSFKRGTVAAYAPGKPNRGNIQENINKNLNKSVMLNRIQGHHATPRPSSATTVHRTSPLCRWRYECTDPGNLDTCKLHTQCNMGNLKATTNADFIGPVKPDEEMRTLRKFRKMLGVSPVDEEVEKILEARIMQFKPAVMIENPARIESLSQYFNNIIVAQLQSSTMPEKSDSYDETTLANLDENDIATASDGADDGNIVEKRTAVDIPSDSDYRRQGTNVDVPHTGRPFLKMY